MENSDNKSVESKPDRPVGSGDNKQALTKDRRDLTTGNIGKKLILFSLPVIAANVLQALYNLVDMAIVGHYDMAAGMSAVNLGGIITNIIFVIAMALTNGGSVIIGQLFGARRKDDAKKAAGTVFTLLIIIAIVLTAAALIFRVPILRAMNTTDAAFEGALSYLTICASGTIVVYIYNANSAILRASGESVQPLIAVASCAVLNLCLDLLMVGKLGMGPAGAAYATIISQFMSAVLTTFFVKRRGLIDFKLSFLHIEKSFVKSMMKIALPNVIQLLLVQLSFAFTNSLINQFGTEASAAAGAVSKLGNFAQLPPQSMMTAIMTLTAQNLGANNIPNIKKGFRIGASVGVGIALIICILIWTIPSSLLGIMTSDAAVIEVGTTFFRLVGISYVFESVLFVLYGILMGSGYTTVTLCCGVLSSLVLRYSLSWIFIKFTNWGFPGVGVAYTLAAFGAMCVAVIFYLTGKWQKPRVKV